MKFIDFIYFISVQAFVRGNKIFFGSFLVVAFWFSMLQLFWINIIGLIVEMSFSLDFGIASREISDLTLLATIFVANNVYLQVGNRKEKILNRFQFDEKEQKKYWIVIAILFISSFVVMGLFFNMARKLGYY
ncbi:MAG: hypothetical protein ACOC4J_02895 [Bacteroidota bacterium]